MLRCSIVVNTNNTIIIFNLLFLLLGICDSFSRVVVVHHQNRLLQDGTSIPRSRWGKRNYRHNNNLLLQTKLSSSSSSSDNEQEYRNAATKVLSNFMSKKKDENDVNNNEDDPFDLIDFNVPKLTNIPIDILAQTLDAELYEKEWFVTGCVNPIYFDDTFKFQDPDIKLSGIYEYAKGVRTIFDISTSRAEIISTIVNPERGDNIITCTWRLSGKVNIGPGLTIKPYIVETDFTVDPNSGLIVFQEDRFNLPQWDILLSALFPFLIGIITSPPEPKPEPRIPPPTIPKIIANKINNSGSKTNQSDNNPFEALQSMLFPNK